MGQQDIPPSRRIATTIIGITMLSAGIAASFTIGGNTQTGLIICGVGMILNVAVLVLGALIVGSTRE